MKGCALKVCPLLSPVDRVLATSEIVVCRALKNTAQIPSRRLDYENELSRKRYKNLELIMVDDDVCMHCHSWSSTVIKLSITSVINGDDEIQLCNRGDSTYEIVAIP